ncbi:MAG: TlpA disulfide reductase family protein [Chitinophagaceae bacterium]
MRQTDRHLHVPHALLSVLFVLLFPVCAPAQVSNTNSFQNERVNWNSTIEYKPLRVGDKVPDFKFSLVNDQSEFGTLYEFKGKFIILDFWATWCSACISHFPKMQLFQKLNNTTLKILLVNTMETQDTESKISEFFKKKNRPQGTGIFLPSLIYDTIANRLFPHKTIPHYVWIDSNMIITAITSSVDVTEENIEKFITGELRELSIKEDLVYDFNRPLFEDGNGGEKVKYEFRSTLTRYLNGVPSSPPLQLSRKPSCV